MRTAGTTYAFDNAWADAYRRLSMLEVCYDPGTQRRLTAIGVGSGWRCLTPGGWLLLEEGDAFPVEGVAAGVVDVAAEADVPVYRGGSPTAEMVRLCFIQVAERDVLDDGTRVLVDEFCAALADPGRWFTYYAAVAAWGQAPR